MKVFAGFIKAERDEELVTVPVSCIADDEQHARATLMTWAKEKWPKEKGWRLHQGFCRVVPDSQIFMDDRIIPPFLVSTS